MENNILENAYEVARIQAQIRYVALCREYNKVVETRGAGNEEAEYVRGHLLESINILKTIFGLSEEMLKEVDKNKGFTNADVEVLPDAVIKIVRGGVFNGRY